MPFLNLVITRCEPRIQVISAPNIDICLFSKKYHIRNPAFNTYSKYSEKTNISYLLVRTRRCTYQGVRNVSSSENFAYALN